MIKIWSMVLFLIFFAFPLYAADIFITAEQKVDVHQEDNKVVAYGDAVAIKDNITVKAQKLTAFFEKKQNENGESTDDISRMYAEDKASLDMKKAQAYGDSIEYNVADDFLLIKGKPAIVKNEKAKISATESITYYPALSKAVAKGNVIADNGKNKIFSDIMETYFEKSKNGEFVLKRVEIPQNPKIVTKDGNVKAKSAIYYPDQGMVYMYENVVITQNGNILKGDKAETNLNTGISRILSGKSRVSGVWYEED